MFFRLLVCLKNVDFLINTTASKEASSLFRKLGFKEFKNQKNTHFNFWQINIEQINKGFLLNKNNYFKIPIYCFLFFSE